MANNRLLRELFKVQEFTEPSGLRRRTQSAFEDPQDIDKWIGDSDGDTIDVEIREALRGAVRDGQAFQQRITLVAQDPFGERHEYAMEGYEARAVQHEMDHLDGLLFLDRLVSRRNDLFRRKVYQ